MYASFGILSVNMSTGVNVYAKSGGNARSAPGGWRFGGFGVSNLTRRAARLPTTSFFLVVGRRAARLEGGPHSSDHILFL